MAPAADLYLSDTRATDRNQASQWFAAALTAAAAYDGVATIHTEPGVVYELMTKVTIPRYLDGVRITGGGTIRTYDRSGFEFAHDFVEFLEQPIQPATKGSYQVITTSPASSLTVGDYVLIYTGNTVPNSAALGSPDSELNRIAAVSGSTVTLEWPLCKNYVQEFFQPGKDRTTGSTSTSYTGTAAPLALRKIRPTCNVEIDNVTIDHRGAGAWLIGDQVVNLSVHDVTAATVGGFQSMSCWTGAWHDVTISVSAEFGQWFSVAYGSRDTSLTDAILTSSTIGQIHATEGSNGLHLTNVTITNAPNYSAATANAVLSVRGRNYDHSYTNVTITNASMSFSEYAAFWIDPEASGAATGYTFAGTGDPLNNRSLSFTVNGTAGSGI